MWGERRNQSVWCTARDERAECGGVRERWERAREEERAEEDKRRPAQRSWGREERE